MTEIIVTRGFAESQRTLVAALFWEAFSDKLGPLMRPEAKAIAFIAQALQPQAALCVSGADGRIVAVAGLKTTKGGLLAAGFTQIVAIYGRFGALWRAPILDLTERPVARHEMLLDGLFVRADLRGQGIGAALVRAAQAEAARQGKTCLCLDVVERNHGARALYERLGFVPRERRVATGPQEWMRRALGFEARCDLIWHVPPDQIPS